MRIEDGKIYLSPADAEPDSLEDCFAMVEEYREGLSDRFERVKTSCVLYNETMEMILEEHSWLSLLALYAMANTGIFEVVIEGDMTAKKIVRKSAPKLKVNHENYLSRKHGNSRGGKAKKPIREVNDDSSEKPKLEVDDETGEVSDNFEDRWIKSSEDFNDIPF